MKFDLWPCLNLLSMDSIRIHSEGSLEEPLTEVEKEICRQSLQFEDFVLGFLDRCFAVIESSSYTQTRQENSKQVRLLAMLSTLYSALSCNEHLQ